MFRRSMLSPIVRWGHKHYLIPTGSYLRDEPVINDLDFLTFKDIDDVINDIAKKYEIVRIRAQGPLYADIIIKYSKNRGAEVANVPINIWKINEENELFQHLAHDYDKQLNISIRKKAKRKGYTLNSNEVLDVHGHMLYFNNIQDIFEFFGIEYRTPQEGHLSKRNP